MKLLNILFFAIPEHEFGYVQYRSHMEATAFRAFTEAGYSVKFLKAHEPGYKPVKTEADEFFFKSRNRFFHIPWKLIRFVRKEKPELVFVHSFIFPVQLLALKWCLPASAKIIVQHHAEKPFKNKIKRWLQRKAYAGAHAFLFASAELAEDFVKQGIISSRKKVHEVMEGSCLFEKQDRQLARKTLHLPEGLMFIWVGRLNENKDPLTVLRAVRKAKAAGLRFTFYMLYGSTEMEEEVKQFIQAQQLSDSVRLVGKTEHRELETWFSAADYFIAASHYEGSGIALCEAMACGCIPVLSKIPSFKSMTENGRYGYLFERSDAEGLCNILLSLDPCGRETESQKVIEKFQKDLSFSAIGRRILAIHKQLT